MTAIAGEVERFLASSKYSSGIGDMVVRAVRHEKCATAGDAPGLRLGVGGGSNRVHRGGGDELCLMVLTRCRL